MAEKIGCGGFYVGDGLKVDAATRTISANGGSTGGTFWVTFTPVAETERSYDPDKTYEEVVAAINAGQIVMAKVMTTDVSVIVLPCGGYTDGEYGETGIEGVTSFGGSVAVYGLGAKIFGISLIKGQTPGGSLHSTLTIKDIK